MNAESPLVVQAIAGMQTSQRKFTIDKVSLWHLVESARVGDIALPNLQRTWAWADENVCRILGTVVKSLTVNSLILMEVGAIPHYNHRPVGFSDPVNGRTPRYLVLDGQQRITALMQLLCGERRPVVVCDKENDRDNTHERFYAVKIERTLECLVSDAGMLKDLECFVSEKAKFGLPTKNKRFLDEEWQFEQLVLPTWSLKDSRFNEWARRCEDWWRGVRPAEARMVRDVLDGFRDMVISPMGSLDVVVQTLSPMLSIADVVEIFENTNRGGVTMRTFDHIAASMAMAGCDIQADWGTFAGQKAGDGTGHGIRGRIIHSNGGLLNAKAKFTEQLFMMAISAVGCLRSGRHPCVSKKDMLALTSNDWLTHGRILEGSFIDAAAFLRERGFVSPDLIVYPYSLVVLAVVFAMTGLDRRNERLAAMLSRWYLTINLVDGYGNGGDRKIVRDVQQLLTWHAGGGDPEWLCSQDFNARRLRGGGGQKSSRATALCAMAIRAGARNPETLGSMMDMAPGKVDVKLVEVFGRKFCSEKQIPRESSDCALNWIPVPAAAAKRLKFSSPGELASAARKAWNLDADGFAAWLGGFGIDPATLANEDFAAFVDGRERWAHELIRRETGMSIIGVGQQLAGSADASDEDEVGDDLVSSDESSSEDEDDGDAPASTASFAGSSLWPEGAEFMMRMRSGRSAWMRRVEGGFEIIRGSAFGADESGSLMAGAKTERKRLVLDGAVVSGGDGSFEYGRPALFRSISLMTQTTAGTTSCGSHVWRAPDGRPFGEVVQNGAERLSGSIPTSKPAADQFSLDLSPVAMARSSSAQPDGSRRRRAATPLSSSALSALSAILSEVEPDVSEEWSSAPQVWSSEMVAGRLSGTLTLTPPTERTFVPFMRRVGLLDERSELTADGEKLLSMGRGPEFSSEVARRVLRSPLHRAIAERLIEGGDSDAIRGAALGVHRRLHPSAAESTAERFSRGALTLVEGLAEEMAAGNS
jgi:hypothetical protein